MGVVYEAEDPTGPRRVAIKLLLTGALDPVDLARFRREAELLGQVEHPNVVRIHSLGQVEQGPYLVTELIEGEPLSGPLAPPDAVAIVLQIADAIQTLHDVGLVYRDLKPSNVLVCPDGRAVLLDFGLVRELTGDSLTRSGDLVGSPAYMSPEQAEGRRTGPRADVYGLGALLYHLLTGRAPFEGPNLIAILTSVARAAPTPPSRVHDVPPHLEAACLRALAKEPRERFASAAELAQALQARAPASAVSPLVLLLSGAVALLLVLLAVLWITRPDPTPPQPAQATSSTPARPAPRPATSPPGPPRPRQFFPWTGQVWEEKGWVWTRFMGNDRLVTVSSKRRVRVWDTETGDETRQLVRIHEVTKDVSADPGGQFVLLIGGTGVRRIDHKKVQVLGGRGLQRDSEVELPQLTVLPGDRFVIGRQGQLTLWRLKTPYIASRLASLGGHKAGKMIGDIAFLPQRGVLISGTAEFPANQKGRELRAHDLSGRAQTGDPWDWLTAASREALAAGGVVSLAVDPTRDRLACGTYTGGAVWVFDLRTKTSVTLQPPSLELVQARTRRVRFDPRGRLFVAWGFPDQPSGEVQRWDPATRAITWRRRVDQTLTDLDLSPNGRRLALGFREGMVEVLATPP